MALTPTREKVSYISISSDAKLRKVVPAGTVGATAGGVMVVLVRGRL